MADKWAQFVLPDNSSAPPPAADKWAKFAVNPNPQDPQQPGTLERAGKAFGEWTPTAASDWPEFGPQFRQQLVDLYNGVAGIVPATNRALQKTGDAMLRGDVADTVRQAPGIVPVAGPMTQQVGQDVETGHYPEALGHFLNLATQIFGPKALENPAETEAFVRSIPETTARAAETTGTVVKGAAKGAAKAAVTTPTNLIKPTPLEMLTTAVGGYLGKEMGIPGSAAGGVVGRVAPQVIRGAISGGKSALEKLRAARAADLEAGQPVPAPQPAGLLGSGAIATPAPADASYVRSVPGEYPAQETPAPRGLLESGPNVIPMEAAPDGSYVRSVPGEYPPNLPPEVSAELTRESPSPAAAPEAAAPAAAAPEAPPESSVPAGVKPEDAGVFKQAQSIYDKSVRWADALHDAGITVEQMDQIPEGRFSVEQIKKGATPGWGNLTDALVEKGILKPGEKPPDSSLPWIKVRLKRLEVQKQHQELFDEMKRSGTVQ